MVKHKAKRYTFNFEVFKGMEKNKKPDSEFFKKLDELIQEHRNKGFVHILGLLEFGKQALMYEATKTMKEMEKTYKQGGK